MARWLALFMLVAFGGCYLPESTANNYGSGSDFDTIYDAKAYGREAVLMHLKWPDDAEFVGRQEVAIVEKHPMYFQVSGKVKAANGLGLKLTHNFTAEVRIHDVDAKEWRYHYVQLGDEVLYSNPWTPPAN